MDVESAHHIRLRNHPRRIRRSFVVVPRSPRPLVRLAGRRGWAFLRIY